MRIGCLEEKIHRFTQIKKNQVFLRADFKGICPDYDQVGRALKKLVKKGKLVRVGYGLYAKAKKSTVSGTTIPRQDLRTTALACLQKLNIIANPPQSEQGYNSGLSTQVPTGRVIAVRGRVSRKIGYNGIYITFEKIRNQNS